MSVLRFLREEVGAPQVGRALSLDVVMSSHYHLNAASPRRWRLSTRPTARSTTAMLILPQQALRPT